MARPEKRNVDYFPHYLSGDKIRYVRKKFGNDGYAVWFILLEQLAKAKDHHIEMNGFRTVLMMDETMVSEAILLAIIEELVDLGEFHRDLWREKKVLYSEKFRDSIEDAYRKRQNQCITTADILELYGLNTSKEAQKKVFGGVKAEESQINSAGNTQSKVKESKEEESKEVSLSLNAHAREKNFEDLTQTEDSKEIQPTEPDPPPVEKVLWLQVAEEMTRYLTEEQAGKDQWEMMCYAAGGFVEPKVIAYTWAGWNQESNYILENWKTKHVGKLTGWIKRHLQDERKKARVTQLKPQTRGQVSDYSKPRPKVRSFG